MPPSDTHLPPSRTDSPPNNAPDPDHGQSVSNNSASMNPSGAFGNPDGDASDENVRFLRSNQLASIDASLARMRNRRRQFSQLGGELSHLSSSREQSRQPTSVGISRRIPIVRRQRENLSSHPNYGDASRSQHLHSVYGWAPGSDDDDDDEEHGGDGEGDSDEPALGGRYSAEADYRSLQRSHTSDIIRYVWQSRLADQNDGRQSSGSSRATRREGGGPSSTLRYGDSNSVATAALLQTVRRHPRFSSRTRTLQNYILDRERSGQDTDDRDWMQPTSNPATGEPELFTLNRQSSTGNRNTGTSELRQLYLEEPPSDRLEETIKYLEMLRSPEEFGIGSGLTFDRVMMNGADFVRDAFSIHGPADCSWLHPGTVFSGSQHAMHCNNPSMLSHRLNPRDADPVIVNGSEPNRIRVYTSSGRNYWARDSVDLGNGASPRMEADGNRHEHWPVKVTIHSVDYSNMTITGTMEAFNIPDKTAGSQGAHIVTYLEGEIVDFKTHSLETKNFQASTDIDGLYWRKLEPFKDIPDDQLARNLVSKAWLNEHLAKGWILMRWKERCFVSPSHSRQGLTISGFYYISLCRENGSIQGMYYDPGSSPYQHLSLGPELKHKMVFPAYSFR